MSLGRSRACGALIRGNEILMVQHREANRTYWTLPGGGLEPGETSEQAAVREVFEETGLRSRAVRLIWCDGPWGSEDACFLMELEDEDAAAALGIDPEEQHLPIDERMLRDIAWIPLKELTNDIQVSRVLSVLGLSTQ